MASSISLPFVRGQVYNRRRDIHARFKGNQYGGIAASKLHPYVFLFTGEEGEAYGYSDTWKDGLFLYSGEGQVGNQQMIKGNKAVLEHSKNSKELLLFTKVESGDVRFEGFFHCVGWENIQGTDRNGELRDLILFHLKPEDAALDETTVHSENGTKNAPSNHRETLRERAYLAAQTPTKKMTVKESARTYYERSSAVRNYVLERANGRCECCGKDAPFLNKNGDPYLESHHIHRLSDLGIDDPQHVAAICPTCHRKIHHGANGSALDDALLAKIQGEEREQKLA